MLIECQNCGAPLDITPNAWFVKCRYCAKSSRVAGLNTVAPQTPPGWQPPPVWTPPAHFPARSVPIEYHQPRAPVGAITFLALALFLVGVSGAVVFMTSSAGTGSSFSVQGPAPRVEPPKPELTKAQAWDGRSTLSCSIGETLEIDGKQASFDGTLIDAAISCTLRIKNCKLKGRTIIAAAMNAKVEIENSTLDAELIVIDAAQASQVSLQKSSRLSSADDGIRMAQAARLTMRDSSIDAKGVAVDLGAASKLTADGGSIAGKGGSITVDSSSEVTLNGTKTEGKRTLPRGVRVRGK